MRSGYYLGGLSILCALAGCSSAVERERKAPKLEAPSAASPSSEPNVTDTADTALIQGSVSGRFTLADSQLCQPLGFPLTLFLTGVFTSDDLVQEQASPVAEVACLHEQVLKARADSWATFIYSVLCEGGGVARLCGALDTRQCAIETMMNWAGPRTTVVSARDRIFGFDYVFPPQDDASRMALYRRVRTEIRKLLDEVEQVAGQRSAGTRDCPNEKGQDVSAAYELYAAGLETERKIDDILAASDVPGASD